VFPKCGDLDDLQAKLDVRQPEPPADDPAVPEQSLDLRWVRVRPDVKVLRFSAEQQVAHAAADEIRDVIRFMEAIEDAERVRVDLAA
jgi:hypothetical protein